MKITLLGCGGSGGVPLVGGKWGDCDPAEPRNRRRRVSLLVETEGKTLLIDTSPDLREQLLDAAVTHLDAVLFTHHHADHCHGLDDLRALVYGRAPIPAYMDAATRETLTLRFDYAFASAQSGDQLYPPLMTDHVISGPFEAAGIPVIPFQQRHGPDGESLGFRIGAMAYSTDVSDLEEAAFAVLEGIELWVVDCLRMAPHPTHAHFTKTLEWIERVRPKRAILTHLNHSMDYRRLAALCPPGVEPGYDGLCVSLPLERE